MSCIDPVTGAVIQGALEIIALEVGHNISNRIFPFAWTVTNCAKTQLPLANGAEALARFESSLFSMRPGSYAKARGMRSNPGG